MKNFITKATVLCSIIALLGAGTVASAAAKVTVKLTASMPWVNSDKKICKQISADGIVHAKSKKSVSWVLEYRGTDQQWHYQKPSNQWKSFSPGTTVPSLTGYYYGKCDQRLQLNPKGVGDAGKGGVATGNLYVVQ